MKYVELHSRSAFSFLEGASVPEELIAAALQLEMPAMALLDRDGFYGSPRFHLAAQKNGIKAHIGAEITVQRPTFNVQRHSKVQSSKIKVQNFNQDVGSSMLDFGQNSQVPREKPFRSHSWFAIVAVIKIFAG